MDEEKRSQALDAWDFRAPFARFHIAWGDGDVTPAFEEQQAYGIVLQEAHLSQRMEILAHREVLVTFSSEHVAVGGRAAQHEPAWVVIVAGKKRETGDDGPLSAVPAGAGVVVQALIHGRSGELLLGSTVPVWLAGGSEFHG